MVQRTLPSPTQFYEQGMQQPWVLKHTSAHGGQPRSPLQDPSATPTTAPPRPPKTHGVHLGLTRGDSGDLYVRRPTTQGDLCPPSNKYSILARALPPWMAARGPSPAPTRVSQRRAGRTLHLQHHQTGGPVSHDLMTTDPYIAHRLTEPTTHDSDIVCSLTRAHMDISSESTLHLSPLHTKTES